LTPPSFLIDFHGIVGTGTGSLLIGGQHNLIIKEEEEEENNEEPNHPIIKKFLEDGPLNPYFHSRWNPKTGKVEPLQSKKPKKKKKNKGKNIQLIVEEEIDEKSAHEEVVLDPFAFLNRKKKLGGVVDLALKERASMIALPSTPSSASTPLTLPRILSSNQSVKSSSSPLSTTRESLVPSDLNQTIFKQIYALMSQIDDLSHPKPYRPNGMTREEKLSQTQLTEERKFTLIKQCEEIA
jgi:hypothetical protein